MACRAPRRRHAAPERDAPDVARRAEARCSPSTSPRARRAGDERPRSSKRRARSPSAGHRERRAPAVPVRTTLATCHDSRPRPGVVERAPLRTSRSDRVRAARTTAAVGLAKSRGSIRASERDDSAALEARPEEPLRSSLTPSTPDLDERRLHLLGGPGRMALDAGARRRRRRAARPCSFPRMRRPSLPGRTRARSTPGAATSGLSRSEIVVGPTDENSACARVAGLPPISTAATAIASLRSWQVTRPSPRRRRCSRSRPRRPGRRRLRPRRRGRARRCRGSARSRARRPRS